MSILDQSNTLLGRTFQLMVTQELKFSTFISDLHSSDVMLNQAGKGKIHTLDDHLDLWMIFSMFISQISN